MSNDCEPPWISLQPKFFPNEEGPSRCCEATFLGLCCRLVVATADPSWNTFLNVRYVRDELLAEASAVLGPRAQPVRAAVSVIVDLLVQGWLLRVSGDGAAVRRPWACRESRDEQKQRTKTALAFSRDEQLSTASVRQFIRKMETRRRGPRGQWITVRSLMKHGPDLARELKAISRDIGSDCDADGLGRVVNPYLQFVTEDARCAKTGLLLSDIWRYFRFTWLTPARSTPGRCVRILVRDAASEMHPVIGIAAIASAIVQQSDRDRAIGWDPDFVLTAIRAAPSHEDAKWMLDSLASLIDGIRMDDLADALEIQTPTEAKIGALEALAKEEAQRHRISAKDRNYRRSQNAQDWHLLSESPLYRAKRAETLSQFLRIRVSFQRAGLTRASKKLLATALEVPEFRKAVGHLVRHVKATSVGIHMMDISVAGAVAPYNILLGGKLVSLLLASPEVRKHYEDRYSTTPSIIASAMKGTKVIRRPHLVLLCTTGLFAGGSSQYNRIKYVPDASEPQKRIEFRKLDQETSFSTNHLSQQTLHELRVNEEQWHDGSDVHGIFGEGVNPKMRKLREGLAHLGLPPEELLQAGSPRAIYLIPLASNFGEVLLHRERRPDYVLAGSDLQGATKVLADFWRNRWLRPRLGHDGIIERLEAESLSGPVGHSAIVRLPVSTDEVCGTAGGEPDLFTDDVSFSEMF